MKTCGFHTFPSSLMKDLCPRFLAKAKWLIGDGIRISDIQFPTKIKMFKFKKQSFSKILILSLDISLEIGNWILEIYFSPLPSFRNRKKATDDDRFFNSLFLILYSLFSLINRLLDLSHNKKYGNIEVLLLYVFS
jgi:hypothetical protein